MKRSSQNTSEMWEILGLIKGRSKVHEASANIDVNKKSFSKQFLQHLFAICEKLAKNRELNLSSVNIHNILSKSAFLGGTQSIETVNGKIFNVKRNQEEPLPNSSVSPVDESLISNDADNDELLAKSSSDIQDDENEYVQVPLSKLDFKEFTEEYQKMDDTKKWVLSTKKIM
ncbi:14331_t:CDS:2 [Funneliformis mosseae]|uniref:14331_t:CDS:1 n=1 Tax=Funneliformis mosseae TaxID=27381 RepID=A0A9N9FYN6_FUNMO|nr:14331_t:CDS:2 [Funneliformis mosseae]